MYRNPFYPPRLFPWIYHPVQSAIPPEPRTSHELLVNLIAMRNAVPVIPLTKMMQYHDLYSWLQSSETFDSLLELAVRHSSIGCARKLVLGMRAKKIAPSERTIILVTRLKVRLGHRTILRLRKGILSSQSYSTEGHVAYSQEKPGDKISRLIQDLNDERLQDVDATSLRLLTEYLATPRRRKPKEHRRAYLYAYRRDMRRIYALQESIRRGQAHQLEGRIVLPQLTLANAPDGHTNLFHAYEEMKREYSRLEARPARDFVPRSPSLSTVLMARLANVMPEHNPLDFPLLHILLIRRLLLQDQRQTAVDYASTYIKKMCTGRKSLTPQLVGRVRQIIHLLVHRKYGCPSYSVGVRTMLSLLRFHPDLAPESHTLFILLQSLRTVRRRGQRSIEALNWFRQRWDEIEDEPVRRTIAKLALQDKSTEGRRIAFEMASREARFGTRWRRDHISLHDLSSPRIRAKPFAEVYSRSWRDKEKWIRMGLVQRAPGFVLLREDSKARRPARD